MTPRKISEKRKPLNSLSFTKEKKSEANIQEEDDLPDCQLLNISDDEFKAVNSSDEKDQPELKRLAYNKSIHQQIEKTIENQNVKIENLEKKLSEQNELVIQQAREVAQKVSEEQQLKVLNLENKLKQIQTRLALKIVQNVIGR